MADLATSLERRRFLLRAASGTVVAGLGGVAYVIAPDRLTREARAQVREDGRPRLPPGQRVIERLKPMGGEPGDPSPRNLRLRIHGAVEHALELSFADLTGIGAVAQTCDVHCVTGWSVLGARWKGVAIRELAARARPTRRVRHVVLEGAHGYTANVRLDHALAATSLVAWELEGRALARAHGAPLRALVPDLYFWKSAKWLTGIRFVEKDEPGFWEARGYHNHADPWLEERYS
jgi:DMSO/TMAO reductase YedYZ molybdopterin-dependent catalytic subunit